MSSRTRCNYCTLQYYKKQYGEENLIKREIDSPVKRLTKNPWTEIYLKEKDGTERFLCVFAAITNQCVCH